MKPEVQAAIESRRQWFWVWTLGLSVGLGFAAAIPSIDGLGHDNIFSVALCILMLAGLWLFVATLRLKKALLAWIAFIAATTAMVLTVFFGFVSNVVLS